MTALCILVVWSLGFEPRRASTRVLERQAMEVARHIPAAVTVWTPGPADMAGKNASLFFYLGHPVQAFRPGGQLPRAGSYCVLPSDRLGDLEEPAGFVFEQTARVEHARRHFLVGRCSWSIDSPA